MEKIEKLEKLIVTHTEKAAAIDKQIDVLKKKQEQYRADAASFAERVKAIKDAAKEA